MHSHSSLSLGWRKALDNFRPWLARNASRSKKTHNADTSGTHQIMKLGHTHVMNTMRSAVELLAPLS